MLVLLLGVAGCANPRRTLPVYEVAESRADAARFLNEALAQGALGVSEITADEARLRWHQRVVHSATYSVLVPRELDLRAVLAPQRPEKRGERWELLLHAAGGDVRFTFRDDLAAARAEVALRRLAQPMTPAESEALARRMVRHLREEEPARRERGARTSGWARDTLVLLTGEDHGTDAAAWQSCVDRLWPRQ
ncbi:MAG: hypothetical protein IT463_00415 [Planctomycetes bacterium]|nr:hypothetical protein [Planctomycetota bacterium]